MRRAHSGFPEGQRHRVVCSEAEQIRAAQLHGLSSTGELTKQVGGHQALKTAATGAGTVAQVNQQKKGSKHRRTTGHSGATRAFDLRATEARLRR